MSIGEIEGVSVGQSFTDRRELYDAGVHRALQAGIVGTAKNGAESIVLSGGYVDDEDLGPEIIYTGHGGRDPNSGEQIEDQKFTRQNAALSKSCDECTPLRVVRGTRHKSPYSPSDGYSYDVLFRITDYWTETGKNGHRI